MVYRYHIKNNQIYDEFCDNFLNSMSMYQITLIYFKTFSESKSYMLSQIILK